MAEIFKFFNSAPGDERWHYASDFADYFGDVLSSGLLHKDGTPNLLVKVNLGTMQTIVEPGKALMQGYQYKNTTPLLLTHGLPEPDVDRIDRIVLRLDKRNNARFIKLFVKEGVSAENPVAPTLQRDNYVHEISLAQIRVMANTASLEQLNLVDERMYEDLCGIVYSLISVPTSVFQQQWDVWFNSIKGGVEAEVIAWQLQEMANFDAWQAQEKADFDAWFASIQNILDGDIAATLAAKITTLEQDFEAHENKTATTSTPGHVQLNDTVTSVSVSEAATANAVKQVNDALKTHVDDFTSHVHFGVTTEANVKTITLTPAPTSLSMGFAVSFANTVANTGAVTLNVNGLGAKPVVNSKGEPLKADALPANSICTVRYNNGNFILQGDGGGDSFDYDKTLEGLNAVRDMSTMYTRNATPVGAIGIGEDCIYATHVSSGLGQYYSMPNVTITNGYLISNANAIYVVDGQDKILVLASNNMYILGDKGSTQIALTSMGLHNQKWFNKSGQLSTDGGDNVFIIDDTIIKKVSMIDASIVKQSVNVGSFIADLCVDIKNQCLYIIGYDKRIKKYTFDLVEVWNTPGNWTTILPRTESNQRIALGPNNEVLVCFVSGSSLMFGKFRSIDGGLISSRYNQLASVSTIANYTSLAMYGGYLMYFDPLAYYTINYDNFDYLSIHQVSYPQTGQLEVVTPSRDGKYVVAAYRQSSGAINISTLKYKVLQQ